jgi:CheY-like chemotaxis protein
MNAPTDHGNVARKASPRNQILFVEDNADDFTLMKRAFMKCDLQDSLVWMQSGEDAVKLLSNSETTALIALIVCDLKMPMMDGFEFYMWTRSKPELQHIPFLLLTCSNEEPDRHRAIRMGIMHYYVKPSRLSKLMEIAESFGKYLNKSRPAALCFNKVSGA